MIPILATILIGVATKIGVGLAASAAKKLLTTDPAPAGGASNAAFADELQRATPPAGAVPPASPAPAAFAPAPSSAAPRAGVAMPASPAAAIRALARRARLEDAAAARLAHGRRPPAALPSRATPLAAPAAQEAAFAVGASSPVTSAGSEMPSGRLGSGALPVATRVPTRRRLGGLAHRMRHLNVAAYRRMDTAR